MLRERLLCAALGLLLLSACGAGPAPRPAPAPKTQYVVNDRYSKTAPHPDDALVCTAERKTGSNIAVRYCATAAAREAQRLANQQALQNANNQRSKSTAAPTAPVRF